MTKLDWEKAKWRALKTAKQEKERKKKAVHPNSMAALKWNKKSWSK